LLGVNLDDRGDHRPGKRAAAERGAAFPLVDVGLSRLVEGVPGDQHRHHHRPSSSNRKCRPGAVNGEFRIGFSMTICGLPMANPQRTYPAPVTSDEP
jgi:hypothetical protein